MVHAQILIVGAGWFGLTMAKTYVQLHPEFSIVVLDSEDSVGGVWSSSRLYPGLKTNNLAGSYENPDYPMTSGVEKGQHISGPAVHSYLEAFAEHFQLKRLIRFRHKVEKVEEQQHPGRLGSCWKLTVERPSSTRPDSFETVTFTVDKLIVAAGVTAHPNMPAFVGADRFGSPIFHAKEFRQRQGLLQTAKRVVVHGGAKSAWDAVYAYANSGVQVDWVIRQSGKGPCWMQPARTKNGSLFEDALTTRLFSLFQPYPWRPRDGFGWLRWLLHCTFLGNVIVGLFWSSHERMVVRMNGYDDHPDTKKLKPWSDFFWSGTSVSILNYPTDFFHHLRSGRVRVHHADIVSVGDPPRTLLLADGSRLTGIDALHCSTGWKPEPSITFSPLSLAQRLGIPTPVTAKVAPTLPLRADAAVLSRFPMLRHQPNITPKRLADVSRRRPEPVPYRLYRYAVPPAYWEQRNICIIGTFLATGQAVAAQCQALWVAAYLDGKLLSQRKPLAMEEIEWETEVQTRFHRLRTPAGTGEKHGEFTFETVPFYDLLLADLGLKTRRKSSWWKGWSEPYGPNDYAGLVDEWVTL